jgi:hypothetical protein
MDLLDVVVLGLQARVDGAALALPALVAVGVAVPALLAPGDGEALALLALADGAASALLALMDGAAPALLALWMGKLWPYWPQWTPERPSELQNVLPGSTC